MALEGLRPWISRYSQQPSTTTSSIDMITYDRYQRIKEIFHSAQDHHTPAERSAFLTEVCGNDIAMREEVEALLTADADNDDFLDSPAYEFAAGMLADELREFSPGQEVGQYRDRVFLELGWHGPDLCGPRHKTGSQSRTEIYLAGIRKRPSPRTTL